MSSRSLSRFFLNPIDDEVGIFAFPFSHDERSAHSHLQQPQASLPYTSPQRRKSIEPAEEDERRARLSPSFLLHSTPLVILTSLFVSLAAYRTGVKPLIQLFSPNLPILNRQQQIKECHAQLLASSLAQSTRQGTGFPLELFDEDSRMSLFEGTRNGCLFMIFGITEVHPSPRKPTERRKGTLELTTFLYSSSLQIETSAFSLQRTLHDRQEAHSGAAKIRLLVGEEEEEDEEEGSKSYPRGMLFLQLSDGFHTVKVSFFRLSRVIGAC